MASIYWDSSGYFKTFKDYHTTSAFNYLSSLMQLQHNLMSSVAPGFIVPLTRTEIGRQASILCSSADCLQLSCNCQTV